MYRRTTEVKSVLTYIYFILKIKFQKSGFDKKSCLEIIFVACFSGKKQYQRLANFPSISVESDECDERIFRQKLTRNMKTWSISTKLCASNFAEVEVEEFKENNHISRTSIQNFTLKQHVFSVDLSFKGI